jgi:hypothetical protein
VTQRDGYFWLKTLAVVAFAILVGDARAHPCVVVPLAARQQERAETPVLSARLTQGAVDQAPVLPTRHPGSPGPPAHRCPRRPRG